MKSLFFPLGVLLTAIAFTTVTARGADEFLVVAHDGVPATSLTSSALKDIYTGKTMYWDGGQSIVIVVLTAKTDAAIKAVSGLEASQFKTFWQRLAFSGRGQQPKKVDDAAALIALLAATKGSVALAPTDLDRKGLKLIEVK